MKDFYVRVTITVIGLCFPGTATNSPRKSGVFRNPEYQWDEHLLANWSSMRHTSQIADTVDVSSLSFQVFFQSHTRKEWQIKHLDLSNQSISKMTLSPLAPLHALEVLNLSNNALRSLSLDLPRGRPAQQRRHRNGSHSRLPRLKVLILQRNQLGGTPKGEHCSMAMRQRNSMWGAGVLCPQEFSILLSYKGAAEKAKRFDRANTIKGVSEWHCLAG